MLDLRSSEVDLHKLTSHIEGVGLKAVQWGHAELIDIIGNALADEAVELTAKLLRPNTDTNNEAFELGKLTFNICVNIGFVQARLWELFADAPMYEQNPRHGPPSRKAHERRGAWTLLRTMQQISATQGGKVSGNEVRT